MNRITSRLSYGNVIGTIALFVALAPPPVHRTPGW
jgi:hypothetical protein